jgi:hypothetical protein
MSCFGNAAAYLERKCCCALCKLDVLRIVCAVAALKVRSAELRRLRTDSRTVDMMVQHKVSHKHTLQAIVEWTLHAR